MLELLMVVVILVVVVSLFSRTDSGRKQLAMQVVCKRNLEKVYMAMEIYSGEHSKAFPVELGALSSEEALSPLVPRYTVDRSVFICPGSAKPAPASGLPFEQGRISYAYYMGRSAGNASEPLMSDEQVNAGSKEIGELVFSDSGKPPGNNHGKRGGNFLFCDGRVEASPLRAAFSLVLTQGVVLLNPKP